MDSTVLLKMWHDSFFNLLHPFLSVISSTARFSYFHGQILDRDGKRFVCPGRHKALSVDDAQVREIGKSDRGSYNAPLSSLEICRLLRAGKLLGWSKSKEREGSSRSKESTRCPNLAENVEWTKD